LTVYLNEQKDLLNYLSKNIKQNITIITGGLRRDLNDKEVKVFNSMYLIQKNKITFYDKKHLVPFGEFIPFRNFLRVFKLTHGETDFSVGKGKNQLSMKYYQKRIVIEPSICYEAIFQTFNSEKIDLFINITNDAWFGSSTGPEQHLTASIFRSVEKGVPLIRSANSGISVITDSNGKILKKLDLNTSGYLESKLSIGNNSTFFTKYKKPILPMLILLLFFINLSIDFFIKKRKSLKII
jgi:apolipoprotein N-acyltransferase